MLTHNFTVLVAVAGTNPDALTRELDLRVCAVSSVLHESKWADLFEGMQVDAGGKVFDITAFAYSVAARRSQEWLYEHSCDIAVTIRYLER